MLNIIEDVINRDKSVSVLVSFWNKHATKLGYSKVRANSPERINAIRKIIKRHGALELRRAFRIIRENKSLVDIPWFTFNFLLKDGSVDKLLEGVYTCTASRNVGYSGKTAVRYTTLEL